MSWLYERRRIPSEKNGLIEARRLFGRWEVVVDRTGESTEYLRSMWVDALKRIPVWKPVKTVLMLGLGIGDNLALLQHRFPGCHVTAVEWDPAMVALYEEIGPGRTASSTIIVGDAGIAVQRLQGRYDLIMLDLFTGPDIGAPARQPTFHARLAEVLQPNGMIIANLYRNPELSDLIAAQFDGMESWTWRLNALVLAQARLPENYLPYRGDSAFLQRDCMPGSGRTIVGNPATGMAWGFWPLFFERHECDQEPSAPQEGPRRFVYWQRTLRRDVPPGWRPALLAEPTRLTGFTDIERAAPADWTSHARRHLARWKKQAEFRIQETPLENFLVEYRASGLPRAVKYVFADSLIQKKRAHGELLTCYGIFRRDGALRGGFVSLHFPESRGALHVASFVHMDAEKASAMYGLIDHWFQEGRGHGLRFMDFDGFWAPGDPPSWKGYSRFKAQFAVTFVRRPPLLVRMAGNWRETLKSLPLFQTHRK